MRSARSAAVFLLRSGRRERQPAAALPAALPARSGICRSPPCTGKGKDQAKDRKGNVGVGIAVDRGEKGTPAS
jgi:hypothetical protein